MADNAHSATEAFGDEIRRRPTANGKSVPAKRLLAGLFFGFVLGTIVGARYLAESDVFRVYLGTFLPPHTENWRDEDIQRLKVGMAKDEVVDVLNLQRVVIWTGSRLNMWKSFAFEHAPLAEDEKSKIAEMWWIPRRRSGFTVPLCLCFDSAQRLCKLGIGEHALGFLATYRSGMP